MIDRLLRPVVIEALLTWEQIRSGVRYNPTASAVQQNPYPLYDRLRRKDPVHWSEMTRGWMVSRYADADRVLRDHRTFGNAGREYGYTPYVSLLDMDPPDHTRLRALVSQAFTPRVVARLAPQIRRTCHDLLGRVDPARFDLIRELAFPLPVIVIADLLGVPAHHQDQFEAWSREAARSVEPALSGAQVARVRVAFDQLRTYLGDLINHYRRHPRDNLLSALVKAEADGDRLSAEDVLMTALLLLIAGHETTRNLLGNGVLALLRYPMQLHRLRQDPGLRESAVHEMLRYDAPVQLDGRIARRNTTVDDQPIAEGQRVVVLIGAANRDPEAFDRPNVFDIGRADRRHLAFGRGIHYCLGSPLALLEGRLAVTALLDRFPTLRLLEEPTYLDTVVLRGVRSLWVGR